MAMNHQERRGKEIFIPYCYSVPHPYYSGVLPKSLGPFQDDAQMIVTTASASLGMMDFGGGVQVYDVFGDVSKGCGLQAVWQNALDWLNLDFIPVGFCSGHFGQPHPDSYLILQKKTAGLVLKMQGIFSGGLDARSQLLRATVSLSREVPQTQMEEDQSILLRILIQKENGEWKSVQENRLKIRNSFERVTWEMALRDIPPSIPVQFDVSVLRDGFGTLRLYDARLYGAECYPDFAHPENCL